MRPGSGSGGLPTFRGEPTGKTAQEGMTRSPTVKLAHHVWHDGRRGRCAYHRPGKYGTFSRLPELCSPFAGFIPGVVIAPAVSRPSIAYDPAVPNNARPSLSGFSSPPAVSREE
jgi:hypothetical protein